MKRTLTGSDGKAIAILDGWRVLQGSDGRMVPIPLVVVGCKGVMGVWLQLGLAHVDSRQ
ncbi:hypothetical protein [Stenotrophomonas sp. Sm10]|uniref:hypothetical protein n=1 Tax=Stenotrophomonas sp. Sm10 TaxID=3002754 RepID=UPI0027E417C8|nr:hypothetical protein [Stenotrophomonas sp. Sm10]MDQ7310545.1 hypothetical protein [Stenotrophomonas sp. Sm10]